MTERSCCNEFFEEEGIELEEVDDIDNYDDERYFPYKRPVLSDSEFVSAAGLRHKSLVQPTRVFRYKKAVAAGGVAQGSERKASRRRVLLKWNLS